MDTCSASKVQLWNGKFLLPEKENTMNRYHILAYTSNRDQQRFSHKKEVEVKDLIHQMK